MGTVEEHQGIWIRARARRRRFVERYERRRAERIAGRHHPLKRPIRVTSGVVLILTGVAVGWLPGPGFVVFAVPGALLVASEWRRAALLMDRVEDETIPRMKRIYAKIFGGPKQSWIEEDPAAWGSWKEQRLGQIPDTGERRRSTDSNVDQDQFIDRQNQSQ